MTLSPLLVRALHRPCDEGGDDQEASENDGLLIDDVKFRRDCGSGQTGSEDDGTGFADEGVSGDGIDDCGGALCWWLRG